MQYPRLAELPSLVERKIVSARNHPRFPLTIYNYTVLGQMTPISQWTEAMKDCRGLILDDNGEVIGRPFQKFWNYEQVSDLIPASESMNVWEKLDGSLGIACSYAGEIVTATRGSFESDQAQWFGNWISRHRNFSPSGETWLFEIIYPENRIVVDYGKRSEAVLLSVMSPDGVDLWDLFESCDRFAKARRFDGVTEFARINEDPRFAGSEGFVVQWQNGFRAKVKLDEYKRLHRLVTQCSTRTIWEMLRTGASTAELLDRVPAEFGGWVTEQIRCLQESHAGIISTAQSDYGRLAHLAASSRKDFAMAAKECANPSVLFGLLDGKDVSDGVWRLVEPKWSTPFRKDVDA